MQTVRLDVTAWRHVPYGGATGDFQFVELGVDWSDCAAQLQIRGLPGDTGTPLASLAIAPAGSEGISAVYDAGYLHPVTGAVVGATLITIQISQTTLEAIPAPADVTQPQALAWDMHLTPPSLPKMQYAFGTFTLNPGVTL